MEVKVSTLKLKKHASVVVSRQVIKEKTYGNQNYNTVVTHPIGSGFYMPYWIKTDWGRHTHNELLAPVGSLLPSTYNKNLIESLVHEGYHHVNACMGKWSSYKQRQLTAIILILT